MKRIPRIDGVLFRGIVWIGLSVVGVACSSSTAPPDGDDEPIPPPGAHLTVSPIPLDKIARITVFGHNNKIVPTGKVYVDTCDYGATGRPCLLERLAIRSPGTGVVVSVSPGDGEISIEGPPGLIVGFQHVTPMAGLSRGDSVAAGDVIGTMFYQHSFDFAMQDNSVTHTFAKPDRHPPPYFHAANPLDRYPEPLRSQLLDLVYTTGDPLGRLSYDITGTASGMWFAEGAPGDDQVFTPPWVHTHLYLGRLAERTSLRIVTTGEEWGGYRLGMVDEEGPEWERLTAANGPVQAILWGEAREFEPNLGQPQGSVLVEVLGDDRLRIEWFDTHEPVTAFTGNATTYTR
jgi:hypothetical protein